MSWVRKCSSFFISFTLFLEEILTGVYEALMGVVLMVRASLAGSFPVLSTFGVNTLKSVIGSFFPWWAMLSRLSCCASRQLMSAVTCKFCFSVVFVSLAIASLIRASCCSMEVAPTVKRTAWPSFDAIDFEVRFDFLEWRKRWEVKIVQLGVPNLWTRKFPETKETRTRVQSNICIFFYLFLGYNLFYNLPLILSS